jgi:hypothetical protein
MRNDNAASTVEHANNPRNDLIPLSPFPGLKDGTVPLLYRSKAPPPT